MDELRENSLFVGSSGGSDPLRRSANDLANFWRGRHNGRATVNAGARDKVMDQLGRWGGRARLAMDAQERIRFSSPDKLADDINVESVWRLFQRPGTEGERQAARSALIRMGQDPDSRQKPKPAAGPGRWKVSLQYVYNGKTLYYETTVTASSENEAERLATEDARSSWRLTVGGSPPEFRAYRT
jgi:hypothetical protein